MSHPRRSHDLAVVGGGSAAFAAASRGSELGAQVLLVHAGTIGGTCVNVGCVPSKTLIRAAENARWNRLSRFRGIEPEAGRIDWAELASEKDEIVASLRQERYIDVVAAHPRIDVLEGRARLRDAHHFEIDGELHRAEKIVIATGARPARPPIPGLDEAGIWDSTAALAAKELPRDLIVLGGRYVALELGQMFARLGSRVTLVQRSEQLLPGEDPDVAEALRGFLEKEGMRVLLGHQAERVWRDGEHWIAEARHEGGSERLAGDAVLAALGRRANSEGLRGVDVDARGFIRVDEDLQTSLPGVYAAGDVIGAPLYVYAAAYEGGLAAENALGTSSTERDYTAIPWVIFTDPQLSGVGLNEVEARETGIEVDVSTLPLSQVPRALAARDARGLVKVVRRRGADQLVGARILAQEGGEQIMEASLMIRFGLPISQVARHFHPYLTQSEAMKLALLGFEKDVESLSCCAG